MKCEKFGVFTVQSEVKNQETSLVGVLDQPSLQIHVNVCTLVGGEGGESWMSVQAEERHECEFKCEFLKYALPA